MPTILIIEDDYDSRRSMAELLKNDGWRVFEAGDGETGIALALRHRPEVIICDLLMPKSNGFQVCRAIRENLQPTRIIVVTGRDYEVDRTTALEAGADEYLLKPVTWEVLSAAIARVYPPTKRRPSPEGPQSNPASGVELQLWGVRGSIPVPGPSTIEYGGNTSCVELRADGELIILDAGSGIRPLGLTLEKEYGDRPIRVTIVITHTHWDHIQGLPFFSPCYNAKNSIRVLGYEGARTGLGTILAGQMETPFFPVSLRDLPSHIAIEELTRMDFSIGPVKVRAKFANHPGICAGYRLFTSCGSIAFLPDNEPYDSLKLQLAGRDGVTAEDARRFAAAERQKVVEFLHGTDIALLDAQYTDEEYPNHIGWGHGSLSSVVSLALDAQVGQLILFHHDPNHDDAKVKEMETVAREQVEKSGRKMEIVAAREGMQLNLCQKKPAAAAG